FDALGDFRREIPFEHNAGQLCANGVASGFGWIAARTDDGQSCEALLRGRSSENSRLRFLLRVPVDQQAIDRCGLEPLEGLSLKPSPARGHPIGRSRKR